MREFLISIKLAVKSIESNKGRTVLSILGIIIGVASVILILTFGLGMKSYVVGEIEAFGTNVISVKPKVPQAKMASVQNLRGAIFGLVTTLKVDDIEYVAKEAHNISGWYAVNMGQAVASYGSTTKRATLFATTSGVFDVDPETKIADGRAFSDLEDKSLAQEVVLGSAIKNELFADENPLGKEIRLGGQNYRVIGVLQERGSTGFFNFDDLIYVPLRTYQKKIAGIDYTQGGVFALKDTSQTDATIAEVNSIMDDRHKITDPSKEDFTTTSISEATGILDQVFLIINLLLVGLTSISLLVAGVGIMNVMYVSVTERTFEIGLRKAVGAKQSYILKQFLLEAIMITVLGGIVGVILSAGVAYVATIYAAKAGFAIVFNLSWSVVGAGLGFAAITGLIFGYYPARKASQLSPMEALRKE